MSTWINNNSIVIKIDAGIVRRRMVNDGRWKNEENVKSAQNDPHCLLGILVVTIHESFLIEPDTTFDCECLLGQLIVIKCSTENLGSRAC
jgi:hypothetical protein